MNEVIYKTIGQEEAGQRIDNYLMRVLKGVPRSHIYRIIRSGEVRINKRRVQAQTRIVSGDNIRIPPVVTRNKAPSLIKKEKVFSLLESCILYEDKELLVLNKPAKMAVHGGSGLCFGVIEAIRQLRPALAYLELAHRLDKDTSGCLLLVKKRTVLKEIHRLFQAHLIQKTYWALLLHSWRNKPEVIVSEPLQKNILQSGERMVFIHPQGKASQTAFALLHNYPEACWVQATPQTGRTHQIRVHSAFLGHPILGDEKYTPKNQPSPIQSSRLYLHAAAIQFTLDGKLHSYEAEIDAPFQEMIQNIQKKAKVE